MSEPLGSGEVRCPRCSLLVGTTLAELNGGETVMRVDWFAPIHTCVSDAE